MKKCISYTIPYYGKNAYHTQFRSTTKFLFSQIFCKKKDDRKFVIKFQNSRKIHNSEKVIILFFFHLVFSHYENVRWHFCQPGQPELALKGVSNATKLTVNAATMHLKLTGKLSGLWLVLSIVDSLIKQVLQNQSYLVDL